jgi:pimeloyl-ACP methyl ester carboxylesterase
VSEPLLAVSARALDEEIVLFTSGGHRLPGILSRPARPLAGAPGVLLLSPGLKHRVGPHRLHIKLARFFTERGLAVFRFDFHGTGDAEGELFSDEVPVLHEAVQNGHFAENTLDALGAFCARAGLDRVIACGLCGGAITGLYAAERDPRVVGLIGFQLPVKVLDRQADYADQLSGGYSDFILTLYLKKLVSPAAWRKFLGGKSEYRLIWKTATRRLGRWAGRLVGRSTPGVAPAAAGKVPAGMNRHFLRAYTAVAARLAMLWIYSEQEGARYDFEGDFEQVCLAGRERPYTKVVIPESNHEFAPDEAQQRLLAAIDAWLARSFGTREGTGA